MSTSLSDNELQKLIDTLGTKDSEVLNDTLQNLIMIAQSDKAKDMLPYLKTLFPKLDKLLTTDNLSAIVQASQIILELTTSYSREVEPYFYHVCPKLVLNLGDSKPVIRKMAMNNLTNFLKNTKNFDLVFSNLLKYGIEHANPQIRHRSMLNITTLIAIDPMCVINSIEFKNMIEKIIDRVGNDNETVSSTGSYIVQQIKANYAEGFIVLLKKISSSSQEKLKKILFNSDPQITTPREIENDSQPPSTSQSFVSPKSKVSVNINNESLLKSGASPIQKMLHEYNIGGSPVKISKDLLDTPPKMRNSSSNTVIKESKLRDHMVYGIFSHSVIDDANAKDWKPRSTATEEMLSTMERLHNLNDLLPHLDPFIQLMIRLLNDMNFKICINSLNMTGLLIKLAPEDHLRPYFQAITGALVEKLGDSKIAIRQIASQILIVTSKKVGLEPFIKMVSPFVKEANWHLREESLNLIIQLIKTSKKPFVKEFYAELIENVIELLDDQKPKVRYSARETIATCLIHSNEGPYILQSFKEYLENELYIYLCNRIENPDFTETLTRNNSNYSTKHEEQVSNTTMETLYQSYASSKTPERSRNPSMVSENPYPPNPQNNFVYSPYKTNTSSTSVLSYSPYKKGGNDSMTSSLMSTMDKNDQGPYSSYDMQSSNDYGRSDVKSRMSGKKPPTGSSSVSPSLMKKPEATSTAASSRSALSRNTNNNSIYSFDSLMSASTNLDRNAQSRQAANRYQLNERTQSAQMQGGDIKGIQAPIDKRTYSAAEKQADAYGFYNRLSQKLQGGINQDVFLEFSTKKELEDFGTNNFDSAGEQSEQSPVELNLNSHKKPPLYAENKYSKPHTSHQSTTSESHEAKIRQSAQNPYRGNRTDLASRVKRLQNSSSIESEGRSSEGESTRSPEGNSRAHMKVLAKGAPEEIHEANEITEEDEYNETKGFSFKLSMNSKLGSKRKIIKAPNNIDPSPTTNIDYKKQTYLSKDELESLDGNIEQHIKVMVQDMKSDDWLKQFEAVNTLRRLLQFHVSNLNSSAMFSLHSVILDILKHIESLRSNVSKNALITLTEMSQVLKKQLDADAEAIILKLIKKGNDTNSFISEEVKKALIAIAQNCSDAKVIPIYQGLNNQKSIPAKMNVAISLEAIIQRNEDKINQIRDFDKLVVMLANFLLDGAVEVRNIAKRATSLLLKYLYGRSEMDKILARNFNEINLGKIYTIIDKELSQNSNPMLVTNSPQSLTNNKSKTMNRSTKGTSKSTIEEEKHEHEHEVVVSYKEMPSNSPPRGTKSSKLNLTKEPQEFEILPNLFAMAESSDWRTRQDSVQSLSDFGKKHAEGLAKSKQLTKYIDSFCKLMMDSNVKVSTLGINCFVELIPTIKNLVEANIITITNAVFTILGTVNSNIKIAGDSLLQNMCKKIDYSVFIPAWTNALPFTNPKTKVIILGKFTELLEDLYSKKPLLVQKNILPVTSKFLEDPKSEIKNTNVKLIQAIYSIMGKNMLDHVPTNKISAISEIVS